MWNHLLPIALLVGSNVFMTFAWYGHLRFTDRPLWLVVIASWGIAFFEYCLQVPANRLGYTVYNPAQLKAMQEIITLLVFSVFSVLYLGSAIRWNHVVGFALLVAAAFFLFRD
ncbi:MAG: DMT family protein [Dokdonella sp.]|uniref:DMT family protein n=1 Tax=Dokdonella sp. TaxID=2291710 RepID=UPI0025C2807F|nr:DMT family protein [Dokdonella sp.]MBX3701618.1 DMT family protein [Dokdonella sp.]MCW5577133.1 DMT family protein [Dokdonella sp.]